MVNLQKGDQVDRIGRKVVVWSEDEDRSGASTGLAGLADNNQGTIVSGDNLRLPAGYPYVYMMYAFTEFAGYPPQRAIITQASLSAKPITINKGVALNYLGPGQLYDFRHAPLKLKTGENTTVQMLEDDEAGVAHVNAVVLFLTNSLQGIKTGKPPMPLTHIHTCTIAQMTINAWTNSALTELNPLEEGDYICWGGRVTSATPISARLVFPGIDERPPLIPVAREEDPTHPYNEYWGTSKYRFRMPDGLPSIDMVCGATETPSEIELYLTKIA
jgi:hypothetical protein